LNLENAMTKISKLDGITADEIDKLTQHHIVTVEQLWDSVAEQYESNKKQSVALDPLVKKTGITVGLLIALLAANTFKPSRLFNRGVLRRLPFFFLVSLVVLGLCLFSAELRQVLPLSQLGQYPALLSRQNLTKGQFLQATDVFAGSLPSPGYYLSSQDDLSGTVLAKDMASGEPLHYEDVLRLQALAASDLPAGALLTSQVISFTWSTYNPNALTSMDQVVGQKLIKSVLKGDPLLSSSIDTSAPQVMQVAAAPPEGLLALRLIRASDLQMIKSVQQDQAFTSEQEISGGLVLLPVQHGDLLLRKQVLTPEQLKDRILVILASDKTPLSPLLQPGDAVSLIFYPSDKTSGLTTVVIPHTWLVALDPAGKTITVAALQISLQPTLEDSAKYDLQVLPEMLP
jgi:hypothetical protein